MSIAFVSGSFAQSPEYNNSAAVRNLSYAQDVLAGSLLVLGSFMGGSSTCTLSVSDTLNGAWTQVDTYFNDVFDRRLSIWYRANSLAGPCTIALDPSLSVFQSFAIHEYTGAAFLSPLHSFVWGAGDGSIVDSTPMTGTCAASAGELVFALYGNPSTGATATVDSPFTLRALLSGGTNEGLGTADDTAAAGDEGATFHTSTDIRWLAGAASFKAAESVFNPANGFPWEVNTERQLPPPFVFGSY